MSIFGTIAGKILSIAKPSATSPAVNSTASADTAKPLADVDIAAVMDQLASKSGQTLDWRHSIVDMMKLLQVDSSLDHRKALATELNYPGDKNDSATMNIWLHKQLMQKLVQNGGKLPPELLS
jgi:hypothetical protein